MGATGSDASYDEGRNGMSKWTNNEDNAAEDTAYTYNLLVTLTNGTEIDYQDVTGEWRDGHLMIQLEPGGGCVWLKEDAVLVAVMYPLGTFMAEQYGAEATNMGRRMGVRVAWAPVVEDEVDIDVLDFSGGAA